MIGGGSVAFFSALGWMFPLPRFGAPARVLGCLVYIPTSFAIGHTSSSSRRCRSVAIDWLRIVIIPVRSIKDNSFVIIIIQFHILRSHPPQLFGKRHVGLLRSFPVLGSQNGSRIRFFAGSSFVSARSSFVSARRDGQIGGHLLHEQIRRYLNRPRMQREIDILLDEFQQNLPGRVAHHAETFGGVLTHPHGRIVTILFFHVETAFGGTLTRIGNGAIQRGIVGNVQQIVVLPTLEGCFGMTEQSVADTNGHGHVSIPNEFHHPQQERNIIGPVPETGNEGFHEHLEPLLELLVFQFVLLRQQRAIQGVFFGFLHILGFGLQRRFGRRDAGGGLDPVAEQMERVGHGEFRHDEEFVHGVEFRLHGAAHSLALGEGMRAGCAEVGDAGSGGEFESGLASGSEVRSVSVGQETIGTSLPIGTKHQQCQKPQPGSGPAVSLLLLRAILAIPATSFCTVHPPSEHHLAPFLHKFTPHPMDIVQSQFRQGVPQATIQKIGFQLPCRIAQSQNSNPGLQA
mmetsp:Transcript_54100/g.65099  ORF Transcript_54100/g.65099 Transcript_54100/m.65099 type:complete len:514 (+) Transcript_54100:693-2234(+)